VRALMAGVSLADNGTLIRYSLCFDNPHMQALSSQQPIVILVQD
jgi:hypothetical protein